MENMEHVEYLRNARAFSEGAKGVKYLLIYLTSSALRQETYWVPSPFAQS
jgi:hypothetical protein